ncbi:hydroxyisourate hydrolase [Brachionus plicatilis]|uniref:5-hydroxyisourate hydrolase n=1 Tax=Brachionus plicatilis TaxID=10195 RepID=A0A3M7Q718_BRAPC|nr:hydroxyisourate hydrolase [Brachionus plicatilis]
MYKKVICTLVLSLCLFKAVLTTERGSLKRFRQNGHISSHVLNLATGKPSPNVEAALYIKRNNDWVLVGRDISNQDGRMNNFLNNSTLEEATYKLVFETENYYRSQNLETFYPQVLIYFKVENNTQNFHVPLVMNQYGYSTYRGS